jgi:hypothetical protein
MATQNPYLAVLAQIEANKKADEMKAEEVAQSQGQQAYINFMQSKKDLAQGLARQGIAGGGSESAMLGANVGYERQRNTVIGNRANTIADIQRNAEANKITTQTQSAAWEDAMRLQEEQRFANTITGYDTIAKVDSAIQAAQIAGEPWKVNYLMAQRAALAEQANALLSGGTGGTSGGTTRTTTSPISAPTSTTAPLALSVPAVTRPLVAGYYNPVNPYTPPKTAVSTINRRTSANPYYR